MFRNDDYRSSYKSFNPKNQFCMHMIQIHTAGKTNQFVESLSMKALESLEDCLLEWPELRGSDPATDCTSKFLNATLYREAVDAFRQAIPATKSDNAAGINSLTHMLSDLNVGSLYRLQQALLGLNERERNYRHHDDDKVGLDIFLRNLSPNEKKMLCKVLDNTTMQQTALNLNCMTKEHLIQFYMILKDITDEKIRKNVDMQTAEILIRISKKKRLTNNDINNDIYDVMSVITKKGLDVVNKALDAPTVENLEAMKQVLGNPATDKLKKLEKFMDDRYD